MIEGLKENVPYIIKSVPERNIDGEWIKEQILDSLKTLKNCGFRVRTIISDNHSANVLAYKLILKEFGHLNDNLFTEHDYQKIYLLHDAVHLIKNVRNDLLNYKRFIFQLLNTMVLKIQFHLKVVKFLGNYSTMFLIKIACLRLT